MRALTTEVHPYASYLAVTLDSSFDDLGIGSLELAELLMWIEDTFAISLPARLVSNAQTPRDLLRAVSTGTPDSVPPTVQEVTFDS